MSEEKVKAQEEEAPSVPFDWPRFVMMLGGVMVILIFLVTSVNQDIVKWVAGLIVVGVIIFAAKTNGWFENFDFERFKFTTVLVGLASLGGFLIWFLNKIIEFMTFDPTPISPAVFLLVCILIGVAIPYWTVARDEDDNGLLFGENRVYYLGWVNFMVMIYSLSSYHFRLWWSLFVLATLIALFASNTYRWIKLKDVASRSKHGLFEVFLSPVKKVYIWQVMLLFIDLLIIPATFVAINLGSWWHLTVVLATYLSTLWLCYLVWMENMFVKINPDALKTKTILEARKEYEERKRLEYNSFWNRMLRALGFNKP